MAVHLINKPIVFTYPPGDPDRIIAPPASGASSEQDVDTSNPKLPQDRLPTVITLKDGTYKPGKIQTRWLDNSFQQALLRAQERLAGGSLPREQEEWRLPHAPVPSRPDFSRIVPVYDDRIGKRRRRGKHKRRDTYPKAVKEKSSEPEYILPPIPIPTLYQNAFSDMSTNFPSTKLSKNIVTSSQPVYLPFVGTASLHPKSMTRTIVREPYHPLPELCHGCRGLTHLHDFKGYLYLDGDEYNDNEGAVSESGKGGSLYDDEAEEEGMMGAVGIPVGATVCHGCAISEIPHLHYNSVDGKSVIGINTPAPSQFSSNDSGHYDSVSQSHHSASINGAVTERDSSDGPKNADEVLFSVERISDPEVPIHQHTKPRQKPPKLPQWIMDLLKDPQSENAANKIRHYEDHCYACQQALRQLLPDNPMLRQFVPEPGKFLGDDLQYFKHGSHGVDNSEAASTSGIGTSIYSEGDIQRLDELEILKEEEEDAKERERREKEKQKEEERIKKEDAEKERRTNLYKAPKAFKPKKIETSVTTGEDPFSKKRSYNIQKNSGFKIKKSDKAPTSHVDIKRGESNWKAPDKFELKKGPSKVTKSDWHFSQRKERLRPETPPPPPPPPVKKKPPTVPIVPKKREPLEQIASLREPVASPPRRRKVEEKPAEKKKPQPPEKKPIKEPEPKKVKVQPEPKKVEPKKKVQPEPEKVITVQKGPEKVKVKPEPKKVTKVVKVSTKVKKPKKGAKAKTRKEKKRKPEISQDTDDSSEEEELSPTPEPYIIESPSPSLESESTPPPSPSQVPLPPSLPPTPSQIALPPSPTPDQIPLPPSLPPTPSPTPPPPEPTPPPPKEPTPLPPKEPTPPPPKEPTPPPPPKEPTPPPPVKKPKVATPKPKPPVSKPVKPKKAMKPKREKKKPVANRKVINKTKPGEYGCLT
ncbi:uncharacterized protein [Amphiura filiformis]|uniref:uncharacterized protein isoform X2 n=1 Tax=Amphiura filiformis TaxID=82378 RepID=UPI003B21E7F2